jgi:hypothetical protein
MEAPHYLTIILALPPAAMVELNWTLNLFLNHYYLFGKVARFTNKSRRQPVKYEF